MAHVIKEWFVSEAPNKEGVYVKIKGREGGIISFLLSLVGIDPTVSLVVDKDNIRFEEGSWSGFFLRVTPIEKLCSGGYGYAKPWKIAVLIAVIGTFTVFLAPIFWIVAVLYYFFNKELKLELYDVGGRVCEIAFKRSVIEGIKIDENEAARVIRIIETLVKDGSSAERVTPVVVGHVRGTMPATPAAPSTAAQRNPPASLPAAAPTVAAPTTAQMPSAGGCPECGAGVTGVDVFCAGCGFKLR